MKKEIEKLIEIIKASSPSEVKLAQKEIEKIIMKVDGDKKNKEDVYKLFLRELDSFDKIKDDDHKAYFINTLKWLFYSRYSNSREDFSKWADFFLRQIQNPSGKVRQAIIRVSGYLLWDLVLDYDHSYKLREIKESEIEKRIKEDLNLFGNFVFEIEKLLDHHFEPRFSRFKYTSSLPAGIYKSLNLLMEEIMPTDYRIKIYEKFLNEIKKDEFEHIDSIISLNRSNILEQLDSIIKENSSKASVDEILKIIYEEEGGSVIKDIFLLICSGKELNINEMNKILEVVNSAWNYFPHKKLNGLSPIEKIT